MKTSKDTDNYDSLGSDLSAVEVLGAVLVLSFGGVILAISIMSG